MYWWHWPSLGEAQARALSLIVLLAGYQTLVFAERLALPALAVERIPRTLVFWTVWTASAVSLLVILSHSRRGPDVQGRAPPGCARSCRHLARCPGGRVAVATEDGIAAARRPFRTGHASRVLRRS